PQIGIDLIGRIRCRVDRHLREFAREGNVGKEVRIRYDILRLVHAIQVLCLQNLTFLKPVVENTESAANDGFRATAMAERPGESHSGSKIGVIVNGILRLVTESEVERHIGANAPLIFTVEPQVYPIDRRHGISGRERELARSAGLAGASPGRLTSYELGFRGLISSQRCEGEGPVEIPSGAVPLVYISHPAAKRNVVFPTGNGGEVVNFHVVLRVQ